MKIQWASNHLFITSFKRQIFSAEIFERMEDVIVWK